jgi:pimeloyl-ACP methyl ester carboxylesterase
MADDAPPRVEQTVLDDLRARLRNWRRVAMTGAVGWDRGTDPAYLAELVASWIEDYDWRPHEERIRALPWERAGQLRLVHQRTAASDAPVVVLLHGWPDSVLRYSRALPLLTDVSVVVPALPGYPFAFPVSELGMPSAGMAELVVEAMARLGHERYVVSGGDIGRGVALAMAAEHPDRVASLHVTDVPARPPGDDESSLTGDERDHRDRIARWRLTEGAYLLQQATRPHSLAVALGDSPAGLAAWIVEKLRAWSDSDGDVESVFPRDDLLTWITAYWVTGSIGTSFGPYVQQSPPISRVEVPTVVTQFPRDTVPAPRSVAEQMFDLRVWQEPQRGGHFGAWERPEDFVCGVRAALDLAG